VCAFRLFIQRHVPHSVRPKKLSLLKVGGNEDVAADNAIKLAGANYGLANQYADASCIKIAPAEATNPLGANQVLIFIALPPGKNVQSSNWMSMQPSGGAKFFVFAEITRREFLIFWPESAFDIAFEAVRKQNVYLD
jgi:hypothetical protein